MRIPFPANVTWEERERVELPPGLVVIWHGDAVEVPDDTPVADVDALFAALAGFDPKAATARQVEAAKFRQALDGLDLDTATAEQLLPVLRALVRYMAVRMASEGE